MVQEDETRRLFLYRMLCTLLLHIQQDDPGPLSDALVSVAASPTLVSKDPTGDIFEAMPLLSS